MQTAGTFTSCFASIKEKYEYLTINLLKKVLKKAYIKFYRICNIKNF